MAAEPKARQRPKADKRATSKEKPQGELVMEIARKVGVDETDQEREVVFKRIVRPKNRRGRGDPEPDTRR